MRGEGTNCRFVRCIRRGPGAGSGTGVMAGGHGPAPQKHAERSHCPNADNHLYRQRLHAETTSRVGPITNPSRRAGDLDMAELGLFRRSAFEGDWLRFAEAHPGSVGFEVKCARGLALFRRGCEEAAWVCFAGRLPRDTVGQRDLAERTRRAGSLPNEPGAADAKHCREHASARRLGEAWHRTNPARADTS